MRYAPTQGSTLKQPLDLNLWTVSMLPADSRSLRYLESPAGPGDGKLTYGSLMCKEKLGDAHGVFLVVLVFRSDSLVKFEMSSG